MVILTNVLFGFFVVLFSYGMIVCENPPTSARARAGRRAGRSARESAARAGAGEPGDSHSIRAQRDQRQDPDRTDGDQSRSEARSTSTTRKRSGQLP